jgi:hypothetical protein
LGLRERGAERRRGGGGGVRGGGRAVGGVGVGVEARFRGFLFFFKRELPGSPSYPPHHPLD